MVSRSVLLSSRLDSKESDSGASTDLLLNFQDSQLEFAFDFGVLNLNTLQTINSSLDWGGK